MPEFVFVYRAPLGYRGSPAAAATWDTWFDSLSGSLVDKGNAVFVRDAHGNTGPDTALGGYSLVTAEDLEAAVALAKACPLVETGGGVEIGELAPVPGRRHPARTY